MAIAFHADSVGILCATSKKTADLSGCGDSGRRADTTLALNGDTIGALRWTSAKGGDYAGLDWHASIQRGAGFAGDFRLRNTITTLKAMLGAFALLSASGGATVPAAGTDGAHALPAAVIQAEVLPSIEILSKQLNLAGRCNGSAFDLNTFINTTAQTSASVRVSSSALTPSLLEQFTDNTGANVGVFNANYPNFHILGFGGGLAPNTPITISIATYTGPNLSGTVTFTSTITFNCTSGQISRLGRAPPLLTPVPALNSTGLAMLALLLGLAGASVLRIRRVPRARLRACR